MDCLCPVYVMRTELNPETNEGATEGGDRDTDHLELIRCLVHQFGRAAESLFEYHDFGFPRDVIRRHIDTIDDAIDSGDYNFGDALDLMRHCLGSLTASSFEESRFREELHDRLLPEQRPMTDLLTALATAFRRDFHKSPHGAELRTELERLQTNWILGEAYTMYQKDPTLDVRGFLAAAGHLPAPDDDLEPWERIAGSISHTAANTLLDLCFAETSLSPDALEAHLNA